MFDHLTPNQAARATTMRAAASGLTARELALVCNKLRPGVDFRGCGKKALYNEYAKGLLSHVSGEDLRAALAS